MSRQRLSWSGELSSSLAGFAAAQVKTLANGPADHVGWVPAGMAGWQCQQLIGGALGGHQVHPVISGEQWHHIAVSGAWVVAISRGACESPVWWSTGNGEELWLNVLGLIGVRLEQRGGDRRVRLGAGKG